MKRGWAVLLALVLLALIVLGFRNWELADWNTWVNKVLIAGQKGGNERTVSQMLGSPSGIKKPNSGLGRGFSPRPPEYPGASIVYVYTRLFIGMGGYWSAYIFLDESGRVIGVHIAQS